MGIITPQIRHCILYIHIYKTTYTLPTNLVNFPIYVTSGVTSKLSNIQKCIPSELEYIKFFLN